MPTAKLSPTTDSSSPSRTHATKTETTHTIPNISSSRDDKANKDKKANPKHCTWTVKEIRILADQQTLNHATWNFKKGDTIDLTEERLERIAEYSSKGRDSVKVWKVLLEYQPESFLAYVAWAREIIAMP